jgi:hypothetical protein
VIVACNLPSGLRIGAVSLVGAHRGPDFPEAGRKFIGSYALTYDVDDLVFSRWLEANAESSVVTNRAVLWGATEDDLVGVIAGGRSPAPMGGAAVSQHTTFKI